MKTFLGFFIMIPCTVVANLLMKVGATTTPSRILLGLVSWATMAGLGVFGCAAFAYAWVLRWQPLNVAQAFAATQFIAVILASSLILSEPIPFTRWIGIGLIACGFVVVGTTTGQG